MLTVKDGYIDNPYKQFIHTSRYARWIESEGRRETWEETVDRYVDFMVGSLDRNHGYTVPANDKESVREAILTGQVLPSMRALMTAGPALERENVAGYNCAYVAVDDLRAFDESLYVLMNGTGIGFSVESKYVSQLPAVPRLVIPAADPIVVEDSKEGWADAVRQQFVSIFEHGKARKFDTHKVRPEGAPLKTFGGRASGPKPLVELNEFINNIVANAQGRRLTPLECHEIMCKIGQIVVVGGVRRSALISLSDLDDTEMRDAKTGEWWVDKPHLSLSNNSAVYDSKPDRDTFDEEWTALRNSGSGERGFFNREGAMRQMESTGYRNADPDVGCNPCSEILLRSKEFCNLSTIVVDPEDTAADLAQKAVVATIIGTWQSSLTNFGYLRDKWRENCEEERLLGVSMTGIYGHPVLNGSSDKDRGAWLQYVRTVTRSTNNRVADEIGINRSAGITCVKPEGTTSQMVGVSSGLHPWFSKYYIRTVRGDKKDPLSQFLVSMGVPTEPDKMAPDSTYVFSFPMAAPDNALTNDDVTAIEHLETWMAFQKNWTDHKPSVTIYVGDDEWDKVAQWVYDHFDHMTGVAFFPRTDAKYEQAPYQAIDEVTYHRWASSNVDIDWSLLPLFESSDTTSGSQELSCMAGGCDLIAI